MSGCETREYYSSSGTVEYDYSRPVDTFDHIEVVSEYFLQVTFAKHVYMIKEE